jgi:alpha-N-arabinofuranosidase
MKSLSYSLGVMLLLSVLPVRATDDMLIYSDRFNNGWGDNWSWMPRYPTNNPVYSGSNSMACVPSGSYQAWWLKSATTIDTTIYTNVSFWLNGGASSGRTVLISGELDGSGLSGVSVIAPSNTWQQFTISLAALGINNKTNLTGFQIGNGTSTQPFFIDDLRLVAAPAPATVHLNVNTTQALRTVDGKVFGINQVGWDGGVNTPASVTLLNGMGNPCLRWPGGSWGDGYHWTNEAWSAGATSPRTYGSFSKDFIALATNTHAQAFIIVNYGTSDASEAAYGVRMFNITNHCNFKYWEVGNEVGGSWEWDWNTNAPYKAHDPWTYAMRFKDYYTQMKAADPSIKIGAVADITEDGTANYTDHPVVNPRTGVTHNGWTPVMLTYMRSNNCLPDFLIEHNYGPAAGDTQDLLYSRCWAAQAASLRQMLTDYLGDAGSNVTLEATECGTGGDKQCVSLTGGLFYADTIGQILQTEFKSRLWWEMRGGTSSLTDPDPAFYGWRTNSDGTILVDGGIVYGSGGVGGSGYVYPTYYVAKLMPHFAADGDTVVSATSDYPLLAVYSVKRTNGTLTMLVINKSSSSNLTANFNLSGYLPFTNATVYSYGIPQDTAARTGVGSPDIQTNTASFQSLSLTFAPFSASVVELSPGNQPPFAPTGLTATSSNAAVALTWSPAAGANSYIIGRGTTSGGPYTNIATGVTATNYLDTGLVNATTYYYVVAATNSYGLSSNPGEAGATPWPWQTQDIGAVGISGGATLSNGVFTVTGAGADIQGTADAFRFVYLPLTGNGTIIARVVSVQNIDPWSKAGVMIRASLDAGAANAFVAVTPGNGVTWQYRSSAGGSTGYNNTGGLSAPYWVKLVRSGNTFTGYRSPDGVTWTPQGTNTFTMTSTVYVGLALTSHNSSSLCTATFDNVTVPGWPPPPAAPTGLTATAGNAQVGLSWSASATATNYYVKRSTTSGSGYVNIATNASLAFTNTGLNNGTTYYYVVSAVNAYGESTNSTEVSATPLAPPAAPTGLAATAGDSKVALNWSASATATNYYVKRSLTSGSGYATIATNASLTFTNSYGLNNGTLYYFVVSALNGSGEGANSTEASARPTSSEPTQLSFGTAGNQLQLNWPADHTGWQLQSQTNSLAVGLSTNWVNVTGSAQTNQVTVPLGTTSGAVFFRLVRPY